jgi:hypothetical protein
MMLKGRDIGIVGRLSGPRFHSWLAAPHAGTVIPGFALAHDPGKWEPVFG